MLKWSPNHPKTIWKRSPNDHKTILKWSQSDPKVTPKWVQNGLKWSKECNPRAQPRGNSFVGIVSIRVRPFWYILLCCVGCCIFCHRSTECGRCTYGMIVDDAFSYKSKIARVGTRTRTPLELSPVGICKTCCMLKGSQWGQRRYSSLQTKLVVRWESSDTVRGSACMCLHRLTSRDSRTDTKFGMAISL